MYNFLLDSLPEDYEGYLLRTDYRVGIQISQALEDEELSLQERLAVAFHCYMGMECLQWRPPIRACSGS